jgi:uroporphyrinogen decarboxylase
MMGQDRLAYLSRKNPELILKIVNSLKEHQLHQIEKMKNLHPLAVFCTDDMGQKGRPLLSPAMHHKFFFEARKEIFDAIHEIGAKAIMHSCGNITELLPELIECGLDGWQTLEPASDIDNNYVKEKFGDKLSFWGGVDNNVLCFGNRESVFNAVKNTFKALGLGGGYVAGPAHDYLNVRVDNAIALRDAVIQYGKYPLELE